MQTNKFIPPLLLLFAAALLNSQTPQAIPTPGVPGADPTIGATTSGTQVVSQSQLAELISTIGQQQVQLARNQVEIDKRLETMTETLRQARIFVARKGGNKN